MQTDYVSKGATLVLISIISALGAFAALEVWAYMQAGVFEYPLDDPYIHLSMAAEMVRGGYGVNHGEYASAASSPLYPVLLMPFGGSALNRYLPLLWNTLALAGLAYFWGRILRDAGYGGWLGVALAAVGPWTLNMPGVAFSGMEHTLHALVTLMALVGLQRFITQGRISTLLLAGMILGPLFRFEGLAISLAVAMVIGFRGRPWAGAGVFAASALPVAGFCFWLTTLGLSPLPNSVMAKLGGGLSPDTGILTVFLVGLLSNINGWPGKILLVLVVGFMFALIIKMRRNDASDFKFYALALVIAGEAHLLVGKSGWMHRYEHYMLVFVVASALIAVAPLLTGATASRRGRRAGLAATGLVMAILGMFYIPDVALNVSYSSSQIYRQQGQMARFQRDYLQAAVAVNDIGWVTYGNDDYVLDLYGLASKQALDNRLKGAPDGWADALTQQHNVRLAMIYKGWTAYSLGPDWVFLGTLDLNERKRFVASSKVQFYAPTQAQADELRPKLREFAATLPTGVTFDFESIEGQN